MAIGLFWALVALQFLGVVLGAATIGKPRPPLTVGVFAAQLTISACIVLALIIWGGVY